jgi:hypothetical protein
MIALWVQKLSGLLEMWKFTSKQCFFGIEIFTKNLINPVVLTNKDVKVVKRQHASLAIIILASFWRLEVADVANGPIAFVCV